MIFFFFFGSELIRSLHVYRSEDGKENEVEREFQFSPSGSYMEMEANPALLSPTFRVSEVECKNLK
jgi:hypothetical protein